ncbi:hypothetical protein MASR1M60_06200 [Rhodocyclaceae bacterium]
MQVTDNPPDPPEALTGIGHWRNEILPRRRRFRLRQSGQQLAIFVEQLVKRRRDMLNRNLGKTWQAAKIEEWVHGCLIFRRLASADF